MITTVDFRELDELHIDMRGFIQLCEYPWIVAEKRRGAKGLITGYKEGVHGVVQLFFSPEDKCVYRRINNMHGFPVSWSISNLPLL